ncbi:MAG: glucuronate isomerase [Chloroflexi bacterium]|nr:glucuronate isomerase [Chloroflexota bacterium]
MMNPNRLFSPEPQLTKLAREFYDSVAALPLVCPHGHIDPRLFSDPRASFGSPVDLFIIPDHYVTRMFYSQGIALESLGVPRVDGGSAETDHRKIWRLFCENFYLFRGTPTGIWIQHALSEVFGIQEKPTLANAEQLYDAISQKLASPEYAPRALFNRFHIEVLCTTDAATDTLEAHQALQAIGWGGRIRPTFRPDAVINLDTPDWRKQIEQLSEVSGVNVIDYSSFLRALEQRRAFFKKMGAVATDHAALTPFTRELSRADAEAIFQRALKGQFNPEDAVRFTAHLLIEMARMSIEDGLVMQLHPGSLRNHNALIHKRFGADRGSDIPMQTEYTRSLLPLLHKYGNDARLTLILFTLDESTYSRELAPLAGHYPAVKLGPPWWFHDSLNGMARYFDQVMETAGLYNTVGFNDDTRAFCSIPARHDVWRRASANWVAGLAARHIIDMEDARQMMADLAVNLAKRAYRL